MFSDPFNPEKSPESLRQGSNESSQKWDQFAKEYKDNNPDASPEEWAEKMGQMPEYEERTQVYEKVTTAPVYGVDAESDKFNQLMTDYLAKGYWLRPKGYASENPDSTEVEVQLDEITEGQQTEGGKMKYETMSESGVSAEAAIGIFELSKRADFGTEELSGIVKGVPELAGDLQNILNTTDEIRQLTSEGASIEELKQKYADCLRATQGAELSLARADVSVQLSGAILSKTKALERTLEDALNSLSKSEQESREDEVPEEAPTETEQEFSRNEASENAPIPEPNLETPEGVPTMEEIHSANSATSPQPSPEKLNENLFAKPEQSVPIEKAIKESERKINEVANLERDLKQAI